MDCLDFCLPKQGAVAGGVLQHAIQVMESTFAKNDPAIFKVGFTHDACWRWGNELYGYRFAKDKWSNMIVLYISREPFSPAMLEAALIEKYRSGLPQN